MLSTAFDPLQHLPCLTLLACLRKLTLSSVSAAYCCYQTPNNSLIAVLKPVRSLHLKHVCALCTSPTVISMR